MFSIIYIYIYISISPAQYWRYIYGAPPRGTSLFIVRTPWLAKVQTSLPGNRKLKNIKQNRKVCLRRGRISGVQDA